MTALEVFTQQDGKVTKAWYAEMNQRGAAGQLAVALFRAQKRSTAAKVYRGGKYRRAAYDVKNWSLSEICRILVAYPSLGLRWGWKQDPTMVQRGDPHDQVLYVDLPQGQVSFHSDQRLHGPDYGGEWDQQNKSRERILAYCDAVANDEPMNPIVYSGPTSRAELHAAEKPKVAEPESPSESWLTPLDKQLQRPLFSEE